MQERPCTNCGEEAFLHRAATSLIVYCPRCGATITEQKKDTRERWTDKERAERNGRPITSISRQKPTMKVNTNIKKQQKDTGDYVRRRSR